MDLWRAYQTFSCDETKILDDWSNVPKELTQFEMHFQTDQNVQKLKESCHAMLAFLRFRRLSTRICYYRQPHATSASNDNACGFFQLTCAFIETAVAGAKFHGFLWEKRTTRVLVNLDDTRPPTRSLCEWTWDLTAGLEGLSPDSMVRRVRYAAWGGIAQFSEDGTLPAEKWTENAHWPVHHSNIQIYSIYFKPQFYIGWRAQSCIEHLAK